MQETAEEVRTKSWVTFCYGLLHKDTPGLSDQEGLKTSAQCRHLMQSWWPIGSDERLQRVVRERERDRETERERELGNSVLSVSHDDEDDINLIPWNPRIKELINVYLRMCIVCVRVFTHTHTHTHIYIYIYIYIYMEFVCLHVNSCRLFNMKSCSYITQSAEAASLLRSKTSPLTSVLDMTLNNLIARFK